jgi:hypothetical protein
MVKDIPCIPVSVGELLDKLSILEIKMARIKDADKLVNVRREWAALEAARSESSISCHDALSSLRKVNEVLWDLEDRIRTKEAAASFDAEFVEIARAIYKTNDERAAIKKKVNMAEGSALVEEKSYQ